MDNKGNVIKYIIIFICIICVEIYVVAKWIFPNNNGADDVTAGVQKTVSNEAVKDKEDGQETAAKEECIINSVKYIFNSYKITKTSDIDIETDEDYSIVSIDMELINMSKSDVSIPCESIYINIIDNDSRVLKTKSRLMSDDGEQVTQDNIELLSAQTRHIKLYYVINDKYVEQKALESGLSKLSLVVNPDNARVNDPFISGMGTSTDGKSYYYIYKVIWHESY